MYIFTYMHAYKMYVWNIWSKYYDIYSKLKFTLTFLLRLLLFHTSNIYYICLLTPWFKIFIA